MYSKENYFYTTKFVITPKLQKQSKRIFHTGVDLYLLALCAIFLGKVTKNKKDNSKRIPPIYKQVFIQAVAYIFWFSSALLLIMQTNWIIKEQIKIGDIYKESVI